MYYRVNPGPVPSSCAECVFLKDCGGLDGDDFKKGCFQRCDRRCREVVCDCVCPCAPVKFDEAWQEVGGICKPPRHCHQQPSGKLPPYYVPQIIHGSNRSNAFDARWVSVPLHSILSFGRRGCEVRFESKDALCEAMKISGSSRIILSSVSHDWVIEQFWADHRYRSLLPRLSALEFDAVTVPNFSFMLDTPRTNALYNLSRIFCLIERMSDSGITTVPHINASTDGDWRKWENVVRSVPNIKMIGMEFQTGLSDRTRGSRFLQRLDRLQQASGRRLHPIAAGGAGWMRELASISDTFTAIDSTPFMKTVKRQAAIAFTQGGRPHWHTRRTSESEPLDELLLENVEVHRKFVLNKAGLPIDGLLTQPLLFGSIQKNSPDQIRNS